MSELQYFLLLHFPTEELTENGRTGCWQISDVEFSGLLVHFRSHLPQKELSLKYMHGMSAVAVEAGD